MKVLNKKSGTCFSFMTSFNFQEFEIDETCPKIFGAPPQARVEVKMMGCHRAEKRPFERAGSGGISDFESFSGRLDP